MGIQIEMKKLLNLGVAPEMDFVEVKQIQLVNWMSFFCASFLLLAAGVNFSNDDFKSRVIEFMTGIILFLNLYVSYKGLKVLAKTILIVVSIVFIGVGLSLMGSASGIQFYFVPMVSLVFLVFSFRQWPIIALLTLVMAGTYYAIDYMFIEGSLEPIKDAASLQIDYQVNIIVAGILAIIILFFFNYLISVTERLYKKQKDDYEYVARLINSVIDASPNGVWVIDKNYRLLVFNKRYFEFCKVLFNGLEVKPGFAIDGKESSGIDEADKKIRNFNYKWMPFYEKALKGETNSGLFDFEVGGNTVKLEVSFAPFEVKNYASGAIMYSRRL